MNWFSKAMRAIGRFLRSLLFAVGPTASEQESLVRRARESSANTPTSRSAQAGPAAGNEKLISLSEFAGGQQWRASRILCFLCENDYRDIHILEADHNLLEQEYSGGNRDLLTRWSVSSAYVNRLAPVLMINAHKLREFLGSHGFDESQTYNPRAERRERWFRSWKHHLPSAAGPY